MNTILRLPAVKARTGLGRSTIYSLISRGEFPHPISLGARAVGWTSDSVEAWIAGRIALSRSASKTEVITSSRANSPCTEAGHFETAALLSKQIGRFGRTSLQLGRR